MLGLPLSRASGQDAARAVRTNGNDPVVDGRLDDPAWTEAPPLTAFLQRNPIEGAAPSESTEVRFLYTDHALFVGFRGFDREPGRIVSRLVRRDQRISADNFSLFLDTYHDRRTAFEISINPSGARRDVFIYGDGTGRDESWDPVFDWGTRTDSLGWTVELRIPFSQLRFAARDSIVFGLRVKRDINRRNEEVNWPFFPRDQAGEVSQYGRLVGLTTVPAPRRLEFLPYVAGSTAFEASEAGNPFATGRRSAGRAGLDAKLGITSSMTVNLTVNPDFGQVEADPAEVNLTAFESFFQERRPFFVEGTNLFEFGLQPSERREFGGGGGGGGQEGLVYTRRIGRSPQVSAADDDGGHVEDVSQTHILGAAKLSGQLGSGWSLGLAQAVTAKERANIVDAFGIEGTSPVEPLTSYSVARAERVVHNGQLAYGAAATLTERRLDEVAFDELHRRAYSGGMDLSGRFGRDQYEFAAALSGSRVEGSEEALLETQLSSARYYQRPGQDHVRLDSTRTALSGMAGYARLAKVTGFLTWDARYETRSPGFEVNDLGFLRAADQHEQRLEAELRWLEPGPIFREFRWRVEEQADFTWGGERTRTSVESRVSASFLNYWNLNATAERSFPSLNARLLRGGPAFSEPGQWEFRGGGRTDFRRSVWASVGLNYMTENETGARRWGMNANVRWRPPGSFSMSVEGRASWGTTHRQYLTQETVSDSTFFVLGELDRREISLSLRADLALTPRLSLEFYGEPFVSAGRYDVIKLASDPRAQRYADRFDVLGPDRLTRPGGEEEAVVDVDRDGTVDFTISEPNFRVVSLRTNAVLRWEFRPGSTLFVVWQQNRQERDETGVLDAGSAFIDTFRASGSHVFAVKIAYWFGL
ncbi:MAG: carbohydrate binding family 9 domain-containing protein [Gemmatimonadota bacterium]|nr:carbohydrate binding family 9 domain-containing protein [Gemmatimonadota bacterium]